MRGVRVRRHRAVVTVLLVYRLVLVLLHGRRSREVVIAHCRWILDAEGVDEGRELLHGLEVALVYVPLARQVCTNLLAIWAGGDGNGLVLRLRIHTRRYLRHHQTGTRVGHVCELLSGLLCVVWCL